MLSISVQSRLCSVPIGRPRSINPNVQSTPQSGVYWEVEEHLRTSMQARKKEEAATKRGAEHLPLNPTQPNPTQKKKKI